METLLSLQGHSAVVTGGARGIGKDIASLFLQQGCNVMILDVLEIELRSLESEFAAYVEQGSFQGYRCDVSSLSSLKVAFAKAEEAWGGIDIVVNNAGILHATGLEDISEAEWDKIMAVNLKGPFFTTQCALSFM